MELRQLQYFLELADTLHFGKAAENLHITEQPLSFQIKSLERELGFKLFDRTTRSVRITPEGEAFRKGVKQGLERIDESRHLAERIASGETGSIRIGYDQGTMYGILPALVNEYHRRFPDIEVNTKMYPDYDFDSLSNGWVDAMVVAAYKELPRGFDFTIIKKDEVVIALPREHPLATKDKIAMTDLAGEKFLISQRETMPHGYEFVAGLAMKSGFQAKFTQECESYLSILAMVACGMGVAMVLGSMSGILSERVTYRPLVDPLIKVDTRLVWREDSHPATVDNLIEVSRYLKRTMKA